MLYISRKDNPLKVLAFGCVGPGGLGDFDPDIYEEIEGPLPEGWQQEQPPKPLLERLSSIFESVPREAFPPVVRAHFRMLQGAIRMSLEATLPDGTPNPDIEAAQAAIQFATLPNGSPLPKEAEPFRNALLAEFEA